MSERLKGKTFILGIGAQKAGTSWLYAYLQSHPDVYMSPIKELHYFDQLYRPDLCSNFAHRFRRQLARKLLGMTGEEQIADRKDIVDLIDRIRMDYDEAAYIEFFANRVPHSIMLAGEVTPSYSLIGECGFAEIRDFFEKEGMALKIIFLMRDPIERFYSALRMVERGSQSFSAQQAFFKYLQNPQFYERSFYHRTLSVLRASIEPRNVYIGFYETLFSHSEVERLCRFLGIDSTIRPDFATRINESPSGTMTEEMRAVACERFSEVYEACRVEFGDAIPNSWNS